MPKLMTLVFLDFKFVRNVTQANSEGKLSFFLKATLCFNHFPSGKVRICDKDDRTSIIQREKTSCIKRSSLLVIVNTSKQFFYTANLFF